MNNKPQHQLENTFDYEFSTSVYYESTDNLEMLHFHKNLEILIVTQGECLCIVRNQKYLLKASEAIFINSFMPHSFSVSKNSAVRRITFHEHLILTLYRALDGMRPQNPVFTVSDSLLDFFLSKVEDVLVNNNALYARISPQPTRFQIKGCLYLLGGEFLEQAKLIPTPPSDGIIMSVVQYISENFQKNISLMDVAKEKGYNYQYLSRTFNRNVDINFKKMLNLYRLNHARVLLKDTNLQISQICFESGFQSIRSFNQICQDIFHKSPKELRKGD